MPLLAGVVGGRAAASGDQSAIGGWGLIEALPWPYFAALWVVGLSFVFHLFRDDKYISKGPTLVVLGSHVGCLIFLLHGAPALLEAEPRFATAWLHAGFTEQILSHGVGRPDVDARFNWPGFFASAAAVAGAAGIDDPVVLLRWAPTLAVLLYVPPLYLIARHLTRSVRAAWLALFLAVLVNWVGQDYFAPQTAGFLMHLWWVAPLVLFFRQGEQLSRPVVLASWRRGVQFDGEPDLPASTGLRLGVLALVLLLTVVVAMSHQLTPMMMVFTSATLVVAGRLRLATLPIVALSVVMMWISVAATAYWVGHLDGIFGDVGNLQVAAGGVAGRVGGSAEHLAVVRTRLVFSGLTWALTALGVWFLWTRKGRPPLTLLILAAAPFAGLLQPYGGEAMMRVFLFSSPFCCMVLAQSILSVRQSGVAKMTAALLAVALPPLFLLMRYGNESFEQVRPDEVRAIEAIYEMAPLGSNIVSPVSQVPWRFIYAADHRYKRPADPQGFLAGDVAALRNLVDDKEAPMTYLVVTTGQRVYATEAFGEPAGWFEDVVQPKLTADNGYRLVYSNPSALVYEFVGVRP